MIATGCSHSMPPSPAKAMPHSVMVRASDFTFLPMTLIVTPGTTVIWTNDDPIEHTVSSGAKGHPDGPLDGDLVHGGDTYQYTFEQAGAYPYFCEQHPAMTGTIIVRDQ